jgi:hypothetical protein
MLAHPAKGSLFFPSPGKKAVMKERLREKRAGQERKGWFRRFFRTLSIKKW